MDTRERILRAAEASFGTRGYEATSLEAVATRLGLTRQAILYWFPSKDVLFGAVVARGADELVAELDRARRRADGSWERIEAVVRAVFALALRRPDLLGLLREVSRLGSPGTAAFTARMAPLVEQTRGFLASEMDAGRMRAQDPSLLLLSAYSAVVGSATEVEVMRALGVEPSLRSAVRARRELLVFLRSALAVERPSP